jgi:Integrase zinc binding domain
MDICCQVILLYQKLKHQILQSVVWPNMDKDIIEHLKTCEKCQITKLTKLTPEILLPLPQCIEPNQCIHADLFGPLKTMSGNKKFILCLN